MRKIAEGMVGVLLILIVAAVSAAAENQVLRVGSELDFRPYAFTDRDGQAAGFSVDLIKAVTNAMGMQVSITTGPWEKVWDGLVTRQLDVLPIVARVPGRDALVDFSLPHTETFDAFFVHSGRQALPNITAAAGKEIVVMRSDAAHHELIERRFAGRLIVVNSIPEGLQLIANGKHDAMLCSKMIGTLEMRAHHISGLIGGPPISDYKRTFSFAVPKGNTELLEKLNQGLLIINSNGEYDRIYQRWLSIEEPWRKWLPYFKLALAGLVVLAGLTVVLQWLVRRRTRELAKEVLERRNTEEALQHLNATLEQRVAERTAEVLAREERLKIQRERMPVGYIVYDEQNRFSEMNPAAERIFGYTISELRGLHSNVIVPVAARPHVDNILRRLAEGDMTAHSENENITKDGRTITCQWTNTPLRDGKGAFMGFLSMVQDITERKQSERALRESEARYRNIIDNLQDGFIRANTDGVVIMASPSVCHIYGLNSPDDLIGQPAQTLYKNPGDRIALMEVLKQLGRVTDFESEAFRRDGTSFPVSLNAQYHYDEQGQIQGTEVFVRDISERKQAQEVLDRSRQTFSELVERAPFGIYVVDSQFRISLMNAGSQSGAFKNVRPVIGRDFAEAMRILWPEDVAADIISVFRHTLETGDPYYSPRFINPRHDVATVESYEWELHRMMLPDGNFGVICYYYDSTKLRETEKALQELNEVLENRVAERTAEIREKDRLLLAQGRQAAMGEMISNIAHQWRQPLNSLGLAVQQLLLFYDRGKFSREFLKENVGISKELIMHMSQTIDDFRNFFRPDKEKAEFNVTEAIVKTVSLVEESFRNRHIAIEVVTKSEPAILGYQNEYAQVLLNILNNAGDAAVERGKADAKVTITVGDERGMSVVTISDNAGGIPEEIMGKIFEPYFTTKGPQQGTGIGLFMSKTIIENNMGGKLSVRNTAEGAEFRIEV